MRSLFFISFSAILLSVCSCVYMKNPARKEIRLLKKGKITDTSSYVYDLPFPEGVSRLMVQGYFTHFTHKRRAAVDFKMPVGAVVTAARGGIVVRAKSDGSKGGINKSYRQHGNYIIIQHADSSRAGYWHLKENGLLVKTGDSVRTGQPVAYSGNTGYTYFPHLHFMVWGYDKNGYFKQIPTRFRTSKGPVYLKAIRRYKNPEK